MQSRPLCPRRRRRGWCALATALAALALAALPPAVQAVTFTSAVTIGEGDTTYDGQDIVVSGATATINGPHTFASLTLTNGAVLTHAPCTATATHKLDINVTGTITVSADSRIDVSGRGYRPGSATSHISRSMRALLILILFALVGCSRSSVDQTLQAQADSGDLTAQLTVGNQYLDEKNNELGWKYMMLAAEQGSVDALKWHRIAEILNGRESANVTFDKKDLSSGDIAHAESEAKKWLDARPNLARK